ncbi:uncharacterized protein LOC5504324 isoform X2 [Nematostella vectensis]|nr:uncharacterized protein LOC5504324 isoform X2 [Nematostella vectensis]
MSEIIDCMVWVVQKTCWSMWKFTEFLGLRILDLFGLIFNTLACLTVIRLPCMVRQFAEMDSMWEWRSIGFLQFFIFLIDIPVIIMGLISIAITFGVILIPFFIKLNEEDVKCDYCTKKGNLYFGGFKLRGIVISYFFRLMCDIFCLPLGLICFFSWRHKTFVREIKESKDWESMAWRKVSIIQFLNLLLDIPCLLIWLVVMVTWRAPLAIVRVKNYDSGDKKWDIIRLEAFRQFAFLFADVFFIVLFLITMVTWRGPLMLHALCHAEDDEGDIDEWTYKTIVAYQAGLIIVDIPCIICAFIVFVTLWRVPSFVRHCKKNEWKLRKNCLRQFALLARDVGLLLLNIICLVLTIVCLLTLWRAYPLLRDLRKYFKQRSHVKLEDSTGNVETGEGPNARQARKAMKSKKARFTWKIRFAAFKHFMFLFIDIPAIAASFIILATVVRLPKLLSKLIQAGNFYMEFSMIVFTQLGKLVVDLVFLLLFIVLMILRPIQSWVHLLEDEDHRRCRELRFYMQWVPDILNKRHQMYREVEEVFSSCLKEKKLVRDVRTRLSLVNAEFLKDLQWVRDKVKKHELDEEYGHLIHVVQFYEGKRAYKMSRLYECELNYLRRPNIAAHNQNLAKFKNEMLRLESQIGSAIRAVEEFQVPKVPLWVEECGLRTRTRRETQRVLVKCLPSGRFLNTILIILNLILIYRGPALIVDLYRRWYDRRKIVFDSLREYLKDFLTVLIIILVIFSLYRAPFLLVEIGNDVVMKRSWKAVRKTVRRYPPQLGQDLVEFFLMLFSWETVRFTFTAILFGILMPAHLFLTVMKFLFGKGCCAIWWTIVSYVAFLGFPFLLSYNLAQMMVTSGQGSAVPIAIGVFFAFLMLFLVLAAVLTFRNREESFSVRPKGYDYVRFNWSNAHVIIFEIVEFLQLLSLVFIVADTPMYGSGILREASRYLLLDFATLEVKFWLATVLFVCWFFVCGLPVILEQVVGSFDEGTFAKQVSWSLLVSLLSNTLFVTVIESFLSFVACSYNVACPRNNSNHTINTSLLLHNAPVNASTPHCASAILIDDPRIECWAGDHRGTAVFGLLALVWYATTSIIFGSRYGDSDHPSQDLKFSPIYNVFINFAKAVMVGVTILAVTRPYLVFGLLIFLNVCALLFTLAFNRAVGFSLSNSFVLVLWRSVTFVCSAIAAVSAIIAFMINDHESYIPLGIFLGGTLLVLVVAIVVSVLRVVRRVFTPVEQQRKEFRAQLQSLEARLSQENQMVNSWSKRTKQWKRLVKNVYEAQKNDEQLADRHAMFEFPEEILPPPDQDAYDFQPPPLPVENHGPLTEGIPDEAELPPPPNYQDLFPHIMGPYGPVEPPSYSELGPPPAYSPSDIPSSEPQYEHKSHSSEGVASDLGLGLETVPLYEGSDAYQGAPYDSVLFLESHLDAPSRPSREADPVLGMECNGKNLLLALEQNIHYSAFSYAFIAQLPVWRSTVACANWTRLLECLRTLKAGLTGNFNSPTSIDVSCADISVLIHRLAPDPDREQPPVFVPESRDPEVIRAQSDAERSRLLEDVSCMEQFGEKWAAVLDKVLPTKPVFRKCYWDDSEGRAFEIHLRRAIKGTIVSVGPRGVKLAKGASLQIPKVVKGQFVTPDTVTFSKGCEPKGSKGPVAVLVKELGILETESKTYITTQGKRLAYDKALDCLHEVDWR